MVKSMRTKLSISLLMLFVVFFSTASRADDTDIYLGNGSAASSEPLVMFSLDYRSNLTSNVCADVNADNCTAAKFFRDNGLSADLPSSGKLVFFDILRLSLKQVLKEVSGVKVGLMMSHNDAGGCTGFLGETPPTSDKCSNGGVILMGFQSLVKDDTNGARALINAKLAALKAMKPDANSPDHPYQGRELFFEFFRYVTGHDVYSGYNGWIDYEQGNSVDKRTNMSCGSTDAVKQKACYDSTIISDSKTYTSPLLSQDSCTKIYTINFLFQVSQSEADADSAITATAATGGMAGINLSGTNKSFNTVIAYLHDTDLAPGMAGKQSVESYFFVSPSQINQTTNGYAKAGGTGSALPLAEDPQELVDALRSILQQILSTSTTFVAASVPVNVFNRATVVDNVYIALFQAETRARWNGNLKKLRLKDKILADGTHDPQLFDALDTPAIAADGRIKYDALTFWTEPSALTDSDPNNNITAGRDGRHIARGGAGQKIPGFLTGDPKLTNGEGGRTLYYDGAAGAALRDLNADSTTATALRASLGAATDNDALALLKFVRGFNADGTMRPWLLGDPLHSRPLPINYGTLGGEYNVNNPAIFIAMGGNDGFMRFFENTTSTSGQSGKEVWAFMPKEVMGIQGTLQKNDLTTSHPYGVDGTPAVFQDEANNKTYLYFGLRRGGSAYYALDITSPRAAPKLQWKIDASTTGFSQLGLAFSTPQIGYVRNASGAKVPAVFFAGGYDKNKDYKSPNGPDSKGRAIYVVHAVTGELIWAATNDTHTELVDSIPSDVTIGDTDGDGLIDRILVGDSGGNVWRADTNGLPSGWKLGLLAKLGYHNDTARLNDRRFFHAPDLVQSRDAEGLFDAVIIGSGDREDPLDKSGLVKNYLFMIKDRNVIPAAGTPKNTNLNKTPADLTDITTNTCLIRSTATDCDVDLTNGWRLELDSTGEKSLASPITFGNVIYFTSYFPAGSTDDATCGPKEGSGALYAVALDDGSAAFNFNQSDDQSGDTTGLANSLDDRKNRLASGGIPAQVVFIPYGSTGLSYIKSDLDVDKPPISNRFRTFWQRQEYQ